MLLEVIVQTAADARAAEEGGADRLEVVRDIQQDGLTPSIQVVREIAAVTRLPLRVMVRDRNTFDVRDQQELDSLRRAIAAFAGLGVDGAVLGFARDGQLDLDTTAAVMAAAPELNVTFHRAFDSLRDPLAAIDALRTVPRIDHILTSGGTGPWTARCDRLREFARRAAGRPAILAGGGVDAEALRILAADGCVGEAHVGRAACEPQEPGAPVSARRVRMLKAILEGSL